MTNPKASVASFTSEDIKYMRSACLLCDNSNLEVKTGCLIVKKGFILGQGWNTDVHAEEMVLKQVNKERDLRGAVIYVTRFPCVDCARKIIECGIIRIFYMSDHFTSGNVALTFLEEAGISVAQIPEDLVWK